MGSMLRKYSRNCFINEMTAVITIDIQDIRGPPEYRSQNFFKNFDDRLFKIRLLLSISSIEVVGTSKVAIDSFFFPLL